jgi:hypothetical protein
VALKLLLESRGIVQVALVVKKAFSLICAILAFLAVPSFIPSLVGPLFPLWSAFLSRGLSLDYAYQEARGIWVEQVKIMCRTFILTLEYINRIACWLS